MTTTKILISSGADVNSANLVSVKDVTGECDRYDW